MKTTLPLYTIALLLLTVAAYSQNPYQSIGKEVKVLTLSGGKFKEFHPNDSLRRVGSVIVNVRTKEVYQFIEEDTLYSESALDPTVISRWLSLDPLMAKYPNISPYAFTVNNPILFIDPDGQEPIKPQVTGVSTLVVIVNHFQISDLTSLRNLFGSNALGQNTGGINQRYMYSNKWVISTPKPM